MPGPPSDVERNLRRSAMDYQVFLVRPPGSTTISGRHTKGASRILRVSDTGITVSPLSSFNAPAAEYAFERMGRVFPSHEDSTELTVEMFDGARGHESIRFCCDSRTALLTALLNKMDDMNGIGKISFPLVCRLVSAASDELATFEKRAVLPLD